nr:hypothetical protein [Tanacetum cinerariifolium]
VENEDDSEGEIDVVIEQRVDNSLSNSEHEYSESEESDFDNPSFPRPPSEPPDVEFDFELDAEEEILVVMNEKDEFDISNDENDDYFPFMFVIRIFLPYHICSKMFLSFLSAESEDTIFDPGVMLRCSYPILSECSEPVVFHWDGTFMCFLVYPDFDESPIEIDFIFHFLSERIMLKMPKSSQKPDNINTTIEDSSKSRISKQFYQNNQAMSFKRQRPKVQRTFLAK